MSSSIPPSSPDIGPTPMQSRKTEDELRNEPTKVVDQTVRYEGEGLSRLAQAHRREYDSAKEYDPFHDTEHEVKPGQEPQRLIDALRVDPSIGRPGDDIKGQDS